MARPGHTAGNSFPCATLSPVFVVDNVDMLSLPPADQERTRTGCDHVRTLETLDTKQLVTWPGYWAVIGQYRSRDTKQLPERVIMSERRHWCRLLETVGDQVHSPVLRRAERKNDRWDLLFWGTKRKGETLLAISVFIPDRGSLSSYLSLITFWYCLCSF